MSRWLPIAVATAVSTALVAVPSSADACSCVRPGPPEVERDRAALVFVGTVADLAVPEGEGPLPSLSLATFEGLSTIKGEPPTPLTVRTAGSSAACGYSFEVGSEYLVYAHERDGELWVGLCSRTALHREAGGDPIAEVTAEIAQLGAPGGPTDPTEPADPSPPQPQPPPATAPQQRGCAGCAAPGNGAPPLVVGVILAAILFRPSRRERPGQ